MSTDLHHDNDAPAPAGYVIPAQLGAAYIDALAHDVKQPLSKLHAYFEAPSDDPLRSTYAACARQVALLVDELYTIAMARHGQRVAATAFDLGDVFDTVFDHALPSAMANAIALSSDAAGVWLRAPRLWLFRILCNLVSNAVKHSGCSRVFLSARITKTAVEIDAEDNGFGLSPDRLIALSQLEVPSLNAQAVHESVSEVSGQGLPSAILLAKAMGGHLWLHTSNKTHGTRWRLELPRSSAVESVQVARPSGTSLSGKVVVVLDDDRQLAHKLAERFAALGAQAHAFTDDLDMLISVQRRALRPDLYVLDYFLADCTVARALRTLSRRPEPLSAAILTGRPRDIPCDGVAQHMSIFTKPLSEQDFQTLVAQARNHGALRDANEKRRASPWL